MRKSTGATEERAYRGSNGAESGIPGGTPRPGGPVRRRGGRLVLGLATAVVAAGTVAGTPAAAKSPDGGTAHARVGGSEVSCSSDDGDLAQRLSRKVADALRAHRGKAAVALYDRSSGTSCSYRAGTAYDSASVVKATLLAALLRQAEEDHRKLSPREKKLATAMITKSDNDSTSTLWREVGRGGVRHFLDLAGMKHTEPGRRGYWGLTQVTAGDQAKLLKLLTSDNRVLNAGSRAYELRLMHKVVASQRWGTPAGAPKDATVHVKNGWLSRATHGWRVNSIGAFTGGGHDYGIAILSQDNRTMGDGIRTVEAAARAVHRELNR
ncbi:serine hydrolase [Streptomyces albus subsp. chlorinus]|uniref:serine hydrolase n=1 Tax=Streptomyces albus TaxID=1888 RepID=UPI00156F8172|nr:serine hydrolase [Streptomyces albus]NSC25329.1 serine hydrolase [Streptomyces albus subsp. chlorinus]